MSVIGVGASVSACPHCATLNPPGARFCAGCGGTLPIAAWVFPGALPTAVAPTGPATADRHATLEWGILIVAVTIFAIASMAIALFMSSLPKVEFDTTIQYGARVDAGGALSLRVRADNLAKTVSDPVWMVIRWDAATGAASPARVTGCTPACSYLEDAATRATYVRWEPLAAGAGRQMTVTLRPTANPAAGDRVAIGYDVAAGVGPAADRIVETNHWHETTTVEGSS